MRKLQFRRIDYTPYILIGPTVLMTVIVMFLPVLRVFYLSFQNYNYLKMYANGYAGIENYVKLFTKDDTFRDAIVVTIKWVFCEISLQLLIGLTVALALNQRFKGRSVVRAISFIPWAVSGVLTTMLWLLMYNEHIGIINRIFVALHLLEEPRAWLGNTSTALGSVIVAELWRGTPFFAVTFLAALQSIPVELYESAKVDGCGAVLRFIKITLPFLKDSIVLTTLLRCIWEFNSIDLIYTMTNGGPMRLTTTLSVYMMQTAIVKSNYGYASAIGVVCFISLTIFALVYLKVSKYGKGDVE